MSVPYALYSKEASSITGGMPDISTNGTPGNITIDNGSTLSINVDDADADAAAAWGRLKQLDKENSLADFIRSQGVEIYTPDLDAFRTQVQAAYEGSETAASWPAGVLEKINALGN